MNHHVGSAEQKCSLIAPTWPGAVIHVATLSRPSAPVVVGGGVRACACAPPQRGTRSMCTRPSRCVAAVFRRRNDPDQMLLCGIRSSRRSVSHTGPAADRHLVSAACLSARSQIELCPRISLMCLTHTHTHAGRRSGGAELTAAQNRQSLRPP